MVFLYKTQIHEGLTDMLPLPTIISPDAIVFLLAGYQRAANIKTAVMENVVELLY